jgi:hypothetical protein
MDALRAFMPTSFGKQKAPKNSSAQQYEQWKRPAEQEKAKVRKEKRFWITLHD